ncbi:MAG: hypothetical protein JWR00_1560 [Rubritepida sp.]|nr:hypothetical protein [Rubritepida sp.]
MLAALGGHFGWPRAELEALTGADCKFYCDAMVALAEARKPAE